MQVGDLSSWVGGAIALGAAGVSVWQGKYARKQAQVAQAALDDARKVRDEAATPVFRISEEQWVWGSTQERFATATVMMEQGPSLSSLTLRVDGPDVRHLAQDMSGDTPIGLEQRFTSVAPGKQINLFIEMEHEGPAQFELKLTLVCVEDGGHERQWTVPRIITAREAPQSDPTPLAWRGRRGR
ncbi:hypothetical protein GTY81_27090 [Streptomyces sp. SID8366]|uniref:hypothetical protein n=1 Tax=unclassified Streptomyces TaxID=2593676 RepID=UPI000DBA0CFC|nr:hypothetical protein [Streptomyces sp. PsTaAH-130]MYU07466.1 hypothetical protein [Streptomyces sp. SID8366]MYU65470.1 hypothetical protein [Streptomyces sp. SID69]RAJ60169.1 hypothetical protein K376_02586 [Streptomyces sp. PsTaAH-130]